MDPIASPRGSSRLSSAPHAGVVKMLDLRAEFARSPAAGDVLLDRYYRVLIQNFPESTEFPPIERYAQRLKDPRVALGIIACTHGESIIGGAHFKVLETPDVCFGVVEHLWCDKEQRKKGWGQQLYSYLESQFTTRKATIAIAELSDPGLMTPAEISLDLRSGVTPQVRLKFWERMGFTLVDAPYIQPPAFGQAECVTHLMLGLKALESSLPSGTIPSSFYQTVIRAYHDSFSEKFADLPEIASMNASLATRNSLNLISLMCPRTFSQTRR